MSKRKIQVKALATIEEVKKEVEKKPFKASKTALNTVIKTREVPKRNIISGNFKNASVVINVNKYTKKKFNMSGFSSIRMSKVKFYQPIDDESKPTQIPAKVDPIVEIEEVKTDLGTGEVVEEIKKE